MEREKRAAEVMASPWGRYFCDEVTAAVSGASPSDWLGLWQSIDLEATRAMTRPDDLLHPMGVTMDVASYWGDDNEIVVRTELGRRVLTGIVEAVLGSPAMDWWSEPFDAASQFVVANERKWNGFDAPATTGAAERVAEWRRRVADANKRGVPKKRPAAEAGGEWWSTPLWHSVTSTRPLAHLPALETEIEEDRVGPVRSRIFRIVATGILRVCEIDGPDDWLSLVERYPFDVTGSVRGDWWRATRIDDVWFIPDWAAVAADFDVVHLTGMGYLTTAGRPLAVAGGHTMMAGFSPDQAFWMTDSFHFPDVGVDWDPHSEDAAG